MCAKEDIYIYMAKDDMHTYVCIYICIYTHICIYVYNEILVIKKEILPFAAMQMDLKNIMLIEISQTKTHTLYCHLCVKSKK